MKLSEISFILDGQLYRDGEFELHDFCTSTRNKPFLTFLEKEKFANNISQFATCIVCKEEHLSYLPDNIKGIYISKNPKYDFYVIHNYLSEKYNFDSKNIISDTAIISERAFIASKNIVIGNNVIIEDNVYIGENVEIGAGSHIYANTVVGGKSFDYAKNVDGNVLGWKDVGRVIIGKNVEILSMTHVAQATLAEDVTYIGDNVKIDAFVHIGHSAHIGAGSLLSAGAIIGGNSKIGTDVWIGINSTVSNRIVIGNNARVSLGAVVTQNVSEGQIVTGNFAISHEKFIDNLKKSI